MASGVSGYAAISTRVRAMYSDLLSPQDMVKLSDAPDVASLIAALKSTPYGKYLAGLKDNELTPRRAILQIKHKLADSYSSVVQQAPEQTRPLIRQLYRYFELGNLKAVLRSIQTVSAWNADTPAWDRVREVLFPFGVYTSIPAQAMVETGNVASAIDLLRGTPYEATISFAARRVSAEQSLFPLEVALDLEYWRKLWAEARKLQVRSRDGGQDHWFLLDMNNLMWVIQRSIISFLKKNSSITHSPLAIECVMKMCVPLRLVRILQL
jgi:vacuolar-type H+-ATPase subunit C/Vma6